MTDRPQRRRYTDDVCERALEVMRADGVAAAHSATGIPKSTLSRWASTAGSDFSRAAAKTKVATDTRAAKLAESTVARLEAIVDLATRCLIRRLEADADMVELDEEDLGTWSDELERFVPADNASTAAKALRRAQLMRAGEQTRDLVGALTRANHDLALLKGEATERGEVLVEFAIPRPNVDAPVVPQAELNKAGFATPAATPPEWIPTIVDGGRA